MGRTRLLKYEAFLDEELAAVPPTARLLFLGLPTIADREGRLEDRPLRIKAQLFPYEDVDVDAMLDELSGKPFIYRYEADGRRYIQIVNFLKHQRPHLREAQSLIPPPPDRHTNNNNRQAKDMPRHCQGQTLDEPRCPVSDPVSVSVSEVEASPNSGDRCKGSSRVEREEAAMASQSPSPPAVHWHPKPVWKADHPSLESAKLNVSEALIEKLQHEFPRVDVAAQIGSLESYALNDPLWASKKKNWRRTLSNWIRRQDEWRATGRASPTKNEPKGFDAIRRAWRKGENIGG